MSRTQMKASLAIWRQRRTRRIAVLNSADIKRNLAKKTKWSRLVYEANVKIAALERGLGVKHPDVPVPIVAGAAAKPNYVRLLKSEMDWALANEPRIHYSQADRMHLGQWNRRVLDISEDCSSSSTCMTFSVGLPDPNGLKYGGQGYTGTLLSHAHAAGREVRKDQLKVGYLVVFGAGTGHHVCMVYSVGKNGIVLFSHGQERGPMKISFEAEQAFQGNAYTCIRTY